MTPPREPSDKSACAIGTFCEQHTGASEDTGDFDELDGDLGGIHVCDEMLGLNWSIVVEDGHVGWSNFFDGSRVDENLPSRARVPWNSAEDFPCDSHVI